MKPFFVRLFEKAAEQGVKIQFPCDFITSPALNIASRNLGSAGGQDTTQKQEATEEVSRGSKLKTAGNQSQMNNSAGQDEQQQENPEYDNTREIEIQAKNPNMHWSDVMILAGKTKLVDLRDVI